MNWASSELPEFPVAAIGLSQIASRAQQLQVSLFVGASLVNRCDMVDVGGLERQFPSAVNAEYALFSEKLPQPLGPRPSCSSLNLNPPKEGVRLAP